MLIQQLTIFLPNFYSFPKQFSCGEITFLNIHKIQPTTHFFSCAAYFFFHVGMLFLRQNIHKFDLYQSESVVQICCRRTSYGLHDLYLEFTWCERLKILLITTLGGNAYRRHPEKTNKTLALISGMQRFILVETNNVLFFLFLYIILVYVLLNLCDRNLFERLVY